MLAFVGKVVRMARFVEMRVVMEEVVGIVVGGWRCGLWLVQNNDSKRKMATSKITARMTRIIPYKQKKKKNDRFYSHFSLLCRGWAFS